MIRDSDGTLYQDDTPVKGAEDLAEVLNVLQATHKNPHVPMNSFEFSKEDLGDVVRYKRRDHASLGRGPSNRQWIMEVDKKSALPTLLQLHQEVDGRWIQISDLRFSELPTPPAEGHFQLSGNPVEINEMSRQRFWFELYVSPGSLIIPAVHVPENGLHLQWLEAKDVPVGMSEGTSTLIAGGISSYEFRNSPLEVIAKQLTQINVVSNDLSQQSVSMLYQSKTVIPWKQKLAPVLDHLHLAYELVPGNRTQRKYIFRKNAKVIPTTLHDYSSLSVTADTMGYTYHFEKIELQRVARLMLQNCDHSGVLTEYDIIDFVWEGAPDSNPFLHSVDLDCVIPQATFETNVAFLQGHFGLTMTMEEKNTETMEIKLVKK